MKMVIFHSYVSLPEGMSMLKCCGQLTLNLSHLPSLLISLRNQRRWVRARNGVSWGVHAPESTAIAICRFFLIGMMGVASNFRKIH